MSLQVSANYFKTLECPISLEYMESPVIDPHGHTFDLTNIIKWSKLSDANNNTHIQCPITREWIDIKLLLPNRMVKDITEELSGGLEKIVSKIMNEQFVNLKNDIDNCHNTISNLVKKNSDLTGRCNFLESENHELKEENKNYVSQNRTKDLLFQEKEKEVEEQKKKILEKECEAKKQADIMRIYKKGIEDGAKKDNLLHVVSAVLVTGLVVFGISKLNNK